MRIDVDRFIFEIKQRPAIWNMQAKEYCDRVKKMKQWEEIIDIFTGESASEEEKQIQGKNLQKRWKTLRDAFTKDRRDMANAKSGSAGGKKMYKYHQQLLFLLPVVGNNQTNSSMMENKASFDIEDITMPTAPKKPKKSDHGNDLDVQTLQTTQKQGESDDPDRLFMLSMVDDLKKLPIKKKRMVKLNILKMIMEAAEESDEESAGSQVINHVTSVYSRDGIYSSPKAY